MKIPRSVIIALNAYALLLAFLRSGLSFMVWPGLRELTVCSSSSGLLLNSSRAGELGLL